MAFPSASLPSRPLPKSPPANPKRAGTAEQKRGDSPVFLPIGKRKRGGQSGNQNARKVGAFSVYHPGPLRKVRLRFKALTESFASGALSPNETINQTRSLHKKFIYDVSLPTIKFKLKMSRFVNHIASASIPIILRQRALETIAHDPFDFFERGYKDQGLGRDADSFFPVSKLSARNSPSSPFQRDGRSEILPSPLGGGVGFATNLTDEQWAVLAPLIPPNPRGDWLTGQPPVIIAANRWGFTRYDPTGEFNDFVIMQNYHQVLQRFPALMTPAQQPAKKRGRPRNQPISPRALLDAIFWKLATGHTWDALPLDFPPMRQCRKYYRRLFGSGRFYTLLLALYNHMRLEADTDPRFLLEAGVFTTTPGQNIALSPGALPTWQNYTALLFMQLAREAYSRFKRIQKQQNPLFPNFPVFKGDAQLSTGKIPGLEPQKPAPTFQPLEQSLIGKKWRKTERDQKTIERIVAKRIQAQNEACKSGFEPASPAIQNRTDLEAESEQ